MLRPRITPCLLVHDGGLVKTVRFAQPKYVGDPINAVKIFNEKEADELVVLDIDATVRGTEPDLKMIARIAVECRMPLCYGGGIRTAQQAKRIIGLGVEKVAISAAALENPRLLAEVGQEIGSQSVVLVLDVKKRSFGRGYEVVTHNGRKGTGKDPLAVAVEAQALGAGEVLINSVDQDGVMQGYDLPLATKMRGATRLPLTVLGGAGSLADLGKLIEACGVVGASAGSLFVFKGALKAVLINYPSQAQKDELFRASLRVAIHAAPARGRHIREVVLDGALLITGGTGSFGHAVLKRFLVSGVREIRIFSRDEKKQDDMRKRYANPKLKFYIGDVRDRHSLAAAFRGVDHCFHAAALKQVPSCEFHPMEAVRTNILGTENVIDAAVTAGVRRLVCLSTDKAVYPINAMGISKAMMEKVMVAASRSLEASGTVICGTRYGNVMASRGSVIPLFVEQIMSGRPITVTDPAMTRFMMTLESAVELVMFAFEHGANGDIFVQKAPAATLEVLTSSMRAVCERPDHPVRVIGTRHGEKLYESLLSREEYAAAHDLGEYYRIPPDGRDLNYEKFVERGEERISRSGDYNSHNTRQLDVSEMSRMLLDLPYMQRALRGDRHEEY